MMYNCEYRWLALPNAMGGHILTAAAIGAKEAAQRRTLQLPLLFYFVAYWYPVALRHLLLYTFFPSSQCSVKCPTHNSDPKSQHNPQLWINTISSYNSFMAASPSFHFFLIPFLLLASFVVVSAANFYRDFDITWGDGWAKILESGDLLTSTGPLALVFSPRTSTSSVKLICRWSLSPVTLLALLLPTT